MSASPSLPAVVRANPASRMTPVVMWVSITCETLDPYGLIEPRYCNRYLQQCSKRQIVNFNHPVQYDVIWRAVRKGRRQVIETILGKGNSLTRFLGILPKFAFCSVNNPDLFQGEHSDARAPFIHQNEIRKCQIF